MNVNLYSIEKYPDKSMVHSWAIIEADGEASHLHGDICLHCFKIDLHCAGGTIALRNPGESFARLLIAWAKGFAICFTAK